MSQYSNNTAIIIQSQNGDEEATEELIRINYPLAVSLAKRFAGRWVDTEDLIQLALVGMLKAIRSFDTKRGTAFSTYAVPMIMGEIKKFLRDDGLIKVSRENKRNGAMLLREKEKFQEVHGREPRIEELRELTGLSEDEICDALNSSMPVSSLFEPLGGNEGFTVESSYTDPVSDIDQLHDKLVLWEAMKKLPADARQLIALRYFKDLSQQKTASIMGISQVKVSRREKKIIEELKKSFL